MSAFASCRTWTEAKIAALSPSDIAQLNYDEMLELISVAPSTQSPPDAPQVTESEVLVRLVYALRQRAAARSLANNQPTMPGSCAASIVLKSVG